MRYEYKNHWDPPEMETNPTAPPRPVIYVCSPYSGAVEENVANALRYCRFVIDKGCNPYAPHLLLPRILDDYDPKERALGLILGKEMMLKAASEVWVFGNRITPGMESEIRFAKEKKISVRYFTDEYEEE